jgi:hypothetical protein
MSELVLAIAMTMFGFMIGYLAGYITGTGKAGQANSERRTPIGVASAPEMPITMRGETT